MNLRFVILFLPILLLVLFAPTTKALTVKEFSNICASHAGECADLPMVQAYIGGALDLLATLDENTDYLATLYCKDPRELFDIPAIARFIQKQTRQDAEKNAMLILVRYFEQQGGCKHD